MAAVTLFGCSPVIINHTQTAVYAARTACFIKHPPQCQSVSFLYSYTLAKFIYLWYNN